MLRRIVLVENFVLFSGLGIGVVSEELSDQRKRLGFARVAPEAVEADAGEALGQDVLGESAEELHPFESHGLLSGRIAAIPIGEAHGGLGDLEDALIADGDAVYVAGEIAEGLAGTAEGGLGVDDPVGCVELIEKALESGGIGIARGLL